MLLTKTIKINILPDNTQALYLHDLGEQYRKACNYVSEYIFNNGFDINSNRLSKVLYKDIRETFGLKSQITQSVIRTVTARYKTVKEQLFRSPLKFVDSDSTFYSIPKTLEWLRKPILFKTLQADLVRSRDYCFLLKGNQISLNTLSDRVKVNYIVPKVFYEYFMGGWSFGTAKLLENNGKWFLHIPVSKEFEEFDKTKIKHVVGIDRGLRFITTEYDERGKTSFISGKDITRIRNKYSKLRADLQSRGTKSAKRVLQRISHRENRWMSDVNHCISKTLVEKYGPNTLFVLEDLVNVSFDERTNNRRKSQKRELHSWSFYQLEQLLTYKARMNNSEVITVSAKYTSQRCPKCGSIDKSSRNRKEHLYSCRNCGYKSNDDRVGAMNIQQLGTQWVSGIENPRFTRLINPPE